MKDTKTGAKALFTVFYIALWAVLVTFYIQAFEKITQQQWLLFVLLGPLILVVLSLFFDKSILSGFVNVIGLSSTYLVIMIIAFEKFLTVRAKFSIQLNSAIAKLDYGQEDHLMKLLETNLTNFILVELICIALIIVGEAHIYDEFNKVYIKGTLK